MTNFVIASPELDTPPRSCLAGRRAESPEPRCRTGCLQLSLQLASWPEGKQEVGLRQPSPACQPTSSSQERFEREGKKPGGCDKWKGVFPDPNRCRGPAYQDCVISFSSSRVILFSILQEMCQLQSSACLLGVQGE